MMAFFRTINSRLARRIGLYVILVSTLLSIFTSGIQIYSEFKRERNSVYETLNQIEKSQLSNIAARVWVLDKTELRTALESLLELPAIKFVAVYEGKDLLIEEGNKSVRNIEKRSFPLIYRANNKNNSIGRLVVKASLDEVYQRVLDRALLIIVSNLAKTFIVALFILYIIYKLVTRHLSRISEYLKSHDSLSEREMLRLTRNERKDDELDLLVESINSMHVRLYEQVTEINQQKKYLAQTLDSIGDAVITTDREGNIERMNPVAEKLTAWTQKEAHGLSIKTVFPIVNAFTQESIPNPIDKVIEDGEVVYLSNHTTLLARDGQQYQIADSAAPIIDDGIVLGMVLIFNDVTEQYKMREEIAKSKQYLQSIMDNSPALIYVKDIEGKYTFTNKKYIDIFQLSHESVLGKTDADIFPNEQAKIFQQNDMKVLRSGHILEIEEVISHDDELNTYQSVKFPLYSEHHEIYAVCNISTDITERNKQQEMIRRSQKMDALGKLTGGIAHDYNNMLGIVIGYAEMLQDMLSDQPKLAEFAGEIYSAGIRGTKLTNKLLDFSRHKQSGSEIVDLNKLIQNGQNMLEKTLTPRINLTLDLAENLWPIKVDRSDLENAIINLSINAMHAMEDGGELVIKTDNIMIDKAGYIMLSILDNGCGMDADTKEHIFVPFYSTKGEQGTGLGLSQVYGFVERCDGIINVESEPGTGSNFIIYLPRNSEIEDSEQIQAENEVLDDTRGNGTILVVDDETSLLTLCSEILTRNGYVVFTAESGEKALDILEQETIDVLLSDVIMPGMDGFQLAAIVREKYPNIKIQMASGFSGELHLKIEDDTLHKNIIAKPYRAITLLNRIRVLLA